MPGADDERGRDRQQHRHRDVEAVPREAALLALLDTDLPLRPVIPVAELDGRRLAGNLIQAVGWSGQELEL